jgi:hypothetical protein
MYSIFNGMIDSDEVQAQLGYSSRSSGGSSRNHIHHVEQEISQEKMEQWMRAQEEFSA